MNKLETSFTGRMPVFLEDLNWIQESYRQAFYGLMAAWGISPNMSYIISGVNIQDNGSDYSWDDGFIALNGEILKVEADSFTKVSPVANYVYAWILDVSSDATGTKVFYDSSTHSCYTIRNAVLAYIDGTSGDYLPAEAETIHHKIAEYIGYTESNWKSVLFESPWENHPSRNVAVKKDLFGQIRIQGTAIIDGGTGTGLIITLPAGYRPSFEMEYSVVTDLGVKSILISPNGQITTSDSINKVVFDGITFKI